MRTTRRSSNLAHLGKIALLIVDMQNDFLRRGSPTEIARARKLIPKLRMIADAMRSRGFPVVHVITRHLRNESDLENLEKLRGQVHCIEGTDGAKIVRSLQPARGDFVVIKNRYSGFFNTSLNSLLRTHGVGIVIIAGLATNGCILATALDAYFRDYWILVPSDCVEAETRTLHEAGLAIIRYLVGPTPTAVSVTRLIQSYKPDRPEVLGVLVGRRGR